MWKNAFVLASGNLATTLISILCAPISSRIYDPQHFGRFATMAAVSSILGLLAFSHFHHIIFLEKEKKDTQTAFHLAFWVNLLVFCLSLIILALWAFIIKVSEGNALDPIMFLAPVLCVLNGISTIQSTWVNRHGELRKIALSRFLQTVTACSLQLLLPIFLETSSFLIAISQILGVAMSIWMLWSATSEPMAALAWNTSEFKRFILSYRLLLISSLPADLINQSSNQMPIFFLKKFVGDAAAGYYSMANRLLSLPVSFLTAGLSEAFKKEAARKFHEGECCRKLVYQTSGQLFAIAIIPFLLCLHYAEPIFVIILGEKWRAAAAYAQAVGILYFMKLIFSPVSYVVFLAKKFKLTLVMDILLFIASLFALWYGSMFSPLKAILYYSTVYGALYFVTFYFSYKYARQQVN